MQCWYCLRRHFSYRLQNSQTLFFNHKLPPFQAMVTGPLKEAGATRFILIHTISSAQNFTGTILVDVIVTKIAIFS